MRIAAIDCHQMKLIDESHLLINNFIIEFRPK